MRTLKHLKRDRQIANAKETMDLYAPLANRLGIYSLKWELEDLSFLYLEPEAYSELVEGIKKRRHKKKKQTLSCVFFRLKDGYQCVIQLAVNSRYAEYMYRKSYW